jgi:hypothetical protein
VFSTCSFGLEARPARAVTRELLEARDHSGCGEQLEVVGQRGGVARVLELAQHSLVGELLAAGRAGQLEELPQERRLVHPGQQKYSIL